MTSKDKYIMWLLSTFDRPRTAFFHYYYHGDLNMWKPGTREEIDAFNELTAPGNRNALKLWYFKLPSINPVAEAFRQILEKAVHENLPVGRKAVNPILNPAAPAETFSQPELRGENFNPYYVAQATCEATPKTACHPQNN